MDPLASTYLDLNNIVFLVEWYSSKNFQTIRKKLLSSKDKMNEIRTNSKVFNWSKASGVFLLEDLRNEIFSSFQGNKKKTLKPEGNHQFEENQC